MLTGASGFVGSHVLDSLLRNQIDTTVLLRNSSSRCFIASNSVEIRNGSIEDPESLVTAVRGVTHVVHCAGCTKAIDKAEFRRINHGGTVNLLNALDRTGNSPCRFLHISSLAAAGPGTPQNPAKEQDPPAPVSEYGRSKLAAELAVREAKTIRYTIVRPPAVYGPRDTGFLPMFKAVKSHLLPSPRKAQWLSLVYVADLAEVVVGLLTCDKAVGQTYYVASREIVTGRGMAQEIASQMKRRVVPLPIPQVGLLGLCIFQQLLSAVTRRANVLSMQKYAELRAPGWVCDCSKLELETSLSCPTGLQAGILKTMEWYRTENWL
ncbi:MAG TPA: NAD-dependent epimerase/dehydratase family protein [Verrucomicrobiae bacterium]|nr:NAD-dependent epimerase/dehydratase family protein [Verrucomicrobiae bacterium]